MDILLLSRSITAPGNLNATATPTFSPAAGTYSSTQNVVISCSTVGSSIFYTTNGATPTTASTAYSGAVTVSGNLTIKAIATAPGHAQSHVGTSAYVITTSAVNTFSVSGKNFLIRSISTQMRGWNQDGLEYVAVQQNSPATWGGIKPNWPYYKTWKPNYTRIPINGDSWLGNTSYNGAGGTFYIVSATSTSAVLGASVTLDAVPGLGATSATVTGYTAVLGGTVPIQFGDGEVRTASCTITYNPIVYHLSWTPGLTAAQTTAKVAVIQDWTLATQPAMGTFADLEQRTITCTSGSNSITWTPALTTVPTAGQSVDLFVWGAAVNCDPDANYKAIVMQAVADAQSIGTTPEVDLHWLGPLLTILGQTRILTCNNQQPPYAPASAIQVHESLCSVFGSNVPGATVTLTAGGSWTIDNTNICLGYINEPFLDSYGQNLSAGTADQALLAGGTTSRYPNGSGGPYNVQATWTMAGTQAGLNAIRGTGATNVILFGGNSYAQDLKNHLVWMPTDTLSPAQIACYWHPYPNTYNGKNPYPYTAYGPWPLVGSDTGYAAPSSSDFQFVTAALAGGFAVIANECGDAWAGTASGSDYTEVNTYGAPALAELQTQADALGFSVVPFCFNPPQSTSSAVIDIPPVQGTQGTFSSQTPMPGMGLTNYNWAEPHP